MQPNLRCMLCGTTYYSAAPASVANDEKCDVCGGYLEQMASALVRKPGVEPKPEQPRRFSRLARRLTRGR